MFKPCSEGLNMGFTAYAMLKAAKPALNMPPVRS
jgi:hypothetical protein